MNLGVVDIGSAEHHLRVGIEDLPCISSIVLAGDPKEQTTRYNSDPSWDEEIRAFADSILNDKPVKNGTSEDALKTMRLVFNIYYSDPDWRESYGIPNPGTDK